MTCVWCPVGMPTSRERNGRSGTPGRGTGILIGAGITTGTAITGTGTTGTGIMDAGTTGTAITGTGITGAGRHSRGLVTRL